MEKVYMDVPKNKKTQRSWESTDRSPYDLEETTPVMQDFITLDHYEANEDDYDMNTYENEFDQMEMDEKNEPDMYDNGNIDFGNNTMPKTTTLEKKIVVEEENPRRVTTTWMKVTKTY